MLDGIYKVIKRLVLIKIIATHIEDVDVLPLDYFSLSHLNSGVISYYIGFWLFNHFIDPLSAVLLSYVCIFIGALIWEFFENIFIIDMKKNKRVDSPLNSLTDVVLVFFGGIIGCCTYELDWVLKITLIGGLILLYGIAQLFTEKKFKK